MTPTTHPPVRDPADPSFLISPLNAERLNLERNVALGGAVSALAILLQMLGLDTPRDLPLSIALYASTLALPMLVGSAAMFECYLGLGPPSYPHRADTRLGKLAGMASTVGGGVLLVAVEAVVFHLSRGVFAVFTATVIVMIAVVFAFVIDVGVWFAARQGQSSDAPSPPT